MLCIERYGRAHEQEGDEASERHGRNAIPQNPRALYRLSR
jgi:hypothetical protein